MILRLLKGRGMVSGLFEKKRDAIPPHLKHWLKLFQKDDKSLRDNIRKILSKYNPHNKTANLGLSLLSHSNEDPVG
jgi:hypothetical protein